MIRNRPTRRRLGTTAAGPAAQGYAGIGSGGNALDYHFSPETGLSADPNLAAYLQDLTPSQLQNALDGQEPNLIQLLRDEQQGTGAGWIPDASGGSSIATSPVWMWAFIAAAALLVWSHSR
jgi:hypothetical protein